METLWLNNHISTFFQMPPSLPKAFQQSNRKQSSPLSCVYTVSSERTHWLSVSLADPNKQLLYCGAVWYADNKEKILQQRVSACSRASTSPPPAALCPSQMTRKSEKCFHNTHATQHIHKEVKLGPGFFSFLFFLNREEVAGQHQWDKE